MSTPRRREAYQSWLLGQLLLFGLLGASLALFVTNKRLRTTFEAPELGLVISTSILLTATIVAVLAAVRFSVDSRRFDLLLTCGFFVAALATAAFAIVPALDGNPVGRAESWTDAGARVLAMALVAAAPFARGRSTLGPLALRGALAACAAGLTLLWFLGSWAGGLLPELAPPNRSDAPALLTLSVGLEALCGLAALVGFGLSYRSRRENLDRWLALGATLLLFSSLHRVFTPLGSSAFVSLADFLRMLGFVVLLIGVWSAIRSAEFGRAVAEERARVAREIHDGLAQYLFAISTHASMLETGAAREDIVPRLKHAAAAAQQEARFAVLALSSASGSAPFDAALRRYVDVLTADGALDVELEIDGHVGLAPDEQIEVFRIVQEGLANVRRHAGARRAEVRIARQGNQRAVTIRDDGTGFDVDRNGGGQGLKNIRARASSIDGVCSVRSRPGRGTALEVTLRS